MSNIICRVCGEEKQIPDLKQYVYKRKINGGTKIVYYCSYNCMIKDYKKNKTKEYNKVL